MRMVEPGGYSDFTEEPVREQGGGEFGAEKLERDLTVVLEVLGEVNCGHPAARKLTLDRVAVGEGGVQTGEKVVRSRSPGGDGSILGAWTRRGQRRASSSLAEPPVRTEPPAPPPDRVERRSLERIGREEATRRSTRSTARLAHKSIIRTRLKEM